MTTKTKIAILTVFVVVGTILAIIEYIGLATPLWHSISYYSQHNVWLFLGVLAFLIGLPLWWIYHILYHRVPK